MTSHSVQHKQKRLSGNTVTVGTILLCHRTTHLYVQAEFEYTSNVPPPSSCRLAVGAQLKPGLVL